MSKVKMSDQDIICLLRDAHASQLKAETIERQAEQIKILRKALADISECGFIPHHSKIIVDIALETTKSEP